MIKKLLLTVFSFLFSLIFIEIFLVYFGPYNNITNSKFESSLAWYERPKNFLQVQPHPDLKYNIKNYFDRSGIKRCDNSTIVSKKNIIGIFGDSFVENISIDPKFEYSCIINEKLKNSNFINFGIGGYNFEQSFARYLIHQKLNFNYVFYLLNIGDQDSIGLMEIDKNENLIIKKYDGNFITKLISKLNISYLLLDVYYLYMNTIKDYHYVGYQNYRQILSNRFSLKPRLRNFNDNDFKKKLIKFEQIVKKNNAQFVVLIYPDKNLVNFFKKNFPNKKEKQFYFILDKNLKDNDSLIFKNDLHWNEKGNIFLAKNLLNIFENLNIELADKNFKKYYKELDLFYASKILRK